MRRRSMLAFVMGWMAVARAGTFDLDVSASELYVRVSKDPGTIASRLAHDHVVVARGWSGRASFDPDGSCRVDVRVPVERLEVDDPAWRSRLGLEKAVSEKQRRQIRESMLDEGQLAAASFPDVTFVATRCDPSEVGYTVRGDLTIRGATREVSVPMTLSREGGTLRATGSFTARATDFGFEPYSAFFGAVKNLDEMSFVVDVVGRAREPS